MRPDGTGQVRLTEDGLNCHARFSPDGQEVVYIHQELGRDSIWRVGVDGKNRRKVLEAPEVGGKVCWSPDGQRLALCLGGQVEVMDREGMNRRVLNLPKPKGMSGPEWR
jgi:TolB protein